MTKNSASAKADKAAQALVDAGQALAADQGATPQTSPDKPEAPQAPAPEKPKNPSFDFKFDFVKDDKVVRTENISVQAETREYAWRAAVIIAKENAKPGERAQYVHLPKKEVKK